ncbi:hypothetical protein BFW01_g1673 [Lasiodiplodia theobromae]|nr:hypothetical protein BFW01_g1673 [Lasiodiplodia theobromae]
MPSEANPKSGTVGIAVHLHREYFAIGSPAAAGGETKNGVQGGPDGMGESGGGGVKATLEEVAGHAFVLEAPAPIQPVVGVR